MPSHHVERVLPYAPDEVFAVAGDVEHYPDFLPWVVSMRTTTPTSDGQGIDMFDAEAEVGFAFLRERFTTSVRRDRMARLIEVGLVRGPFRHLRTRWAFHLHPRGARVAFDIDFAFKTRLLNAILTANFDRAVDRLISSFEARAAALYPAQTAEPTDG